MQAVIARSAPGEMNTNLDEMPHLRGRAGSVHFFPVQAGVAQLRPGWSTRRRIAGQRLRSE